MGRFVAGDIVVVDFPYSNFSKQKRRPALVLAAVAYDDYVLCQITSQVQPGRNQVQIVQDDFQRGTLNKVSYARPDFIATFAEGRILYHVGTINPTKLYAVIDEVIRVLRPNPAQMTQDDAGDNQQDGGESTAEHDNN